MSHYFYFGGLLIGFIWTFKSLQSSNLENAFKKGHIWQIRSIYTLLSLFGGHILGAIVERIYFLITAALSL